jgi:hypothetical protein
VDENKIKWVEHCSVNTCSVPAARVSTNGLWFNLEASKLFKSKRVILGYNKEENCIYIKSAGGGDFGYVVKVMPRKKSKQPHVYVGCRRFMKEASLKTKTSIRLRLENNIIIGDIPKG